MIRSLLCGPIQLPVCTASLVLERTFKQTCLGGGQVCSLWAKAFFSDQSVEFDRPQISCGIVIEECVDAHCAQKATVGVRVLGSWEATEVFVHSEVNECVTIREGADRYRSIDKVSTLR